MKKIAMFLVAGAVALTIVGCKPKEEKKTDADKPAAEKTTDKPADKAAEK